ncbi:PREDICTED: uncharacterized protein LOC109354844 isoform X1 [Lupinus angustifolius]|uniref:uncharacterized protein LOC109354844 isoform X1 n=1 Tax=Lupinus angustifolius TaxID=3871 RepID=UPI00092EFFA8|nr:PREDICTED: uncharacterized protein LOC109354844 isoform X1 [Lupinus angustifolius]
MVRDKVVVKKVIAEGLQSGWVKKTRITTKEVITSNPTLSANIGLSSDLDMIANDQQISNPACSGEHMPMSMPISEHVSSQCVVDTKLTSSVLSQAEGSDQKQGLAVLDKSNVAPSCTDDAQERQLQENAQTKSGTEKAQTCQRKRHKKEINLPRRASKRLAGIKVDPLLELQTRGRSRRVAVKQSCEGETTTNEDKSLNSLHNGEAKQINTLDGGSEKCLYDSAANTPKSGSKHFYGKLPTSEKLHEKTVEEHGSNAGQECFPFLPREKHATMTENVRILENGDKVNGKLDYSLDCPLGELLTDHCIAFAIQTLTGVTFETSNDSQISPELKNIEHHETFLAAEGHGTKNIKGSLNMCDDVDKEGCIVFPSLAISQEHASGAKIDDKSEDNNNTGPSSEKTLGISPSWMDPCIEFAIKTLTMPLDSDQNPKNCLQQQQHSDMASSSVDLGNLNQTDYYSSQYFGAQRSMFKKNSFDDPTLQHSRNVGIGNSAGTILPHCGEDRRNIWQR